MIFSHAFAGAALTRYLHKSSRLKFTEKQTNTIYFVGIISAILPDLDVALIFLNNTVQHRTLITHSVVPYLFAALILWTVALLQKNSFLKFISVTFLFNVFFSHFFLDMLAGGLVFFAPFSNRHVGFSLNFPPEPLLWAKTYLTSKYMILEVLLTVGYLLTIREFKNKVLIYLPAFLFFVSALSFAALFLVIL